MAEVGASLARAARQHRCQRADWRWPVTVYQSSPIKQKRHRSTKADLGVLDAHIAYTVKREAPMTVRQLYYRLVSAGVIDKTEQEYNRVGRQLLKLRRERAVRYGDIADGARTTWRQTTYSGVQDAVDEWAAVYRRGLWNESPYHVQVWAEKDALTNILLTECRPLDVDLCVCRGYPSESYLWHEAASFVQSEKAEYHILYVGDHDPSGVDIPRSIEDGIRRLIEHEGGDPDALRFHRLAVNEQQIKDYGLITRPTKASDTRAKNFAGESVEVDAIPPRELRRIVREAVERYVDHDHLAAIKVAEASERDYLRRMAAMMEGEE